MIVDPSRYEVPEDWPARPAASGLALCSSLMRGADFSDATI
jgi:hypothetical protein